MIILGDEGSPYSWYLALVKGKWTTKRGGRILDVHYFWTYGGAARADRNLYRTWIDPRDMKEVYTSLPYRRYEAYRFPIVASWILVPEVDFRGERIKAPKAAEVQRCLQECVQRTNPK